MSSQLWTAIQAHRGRVSVPEGIELNVYEGDEADLVADDLRPPEGILGPVSGFSCIIVYADSKGRFSQRRITCARIESAAS